MVVDDDTHGLYLIARGLGADPVRTRAVQGAAAAAVSLVLRSIALDPRAPLDVLARLAVEDANGVVWRQHRERRHEVQVVLTVLLIRNGQVAVGHVGHGRVLRLVGGLVVPLTVEHTLAGAHGRRGYPLPEGMPSRPYGLTRCLGERMFVDVDVHAHELMPECTYVLLSAGFDGVDVGEGLGPLAEGVDPSRVPAKLIELARSAGQQERLSALVVQPLGRKDLAEGDAAPLQVRSSLGSRVWSSLQRGVARGFSRSP